MPRIKLKKETKQNREIQHKYLDFTVYKSSAELHAVYSVINQKNQNVGISILALYYGKRWEFALNTLDHRMDGHVHTIYHNDCEYKIYRKIKNNKEKAYLRLIK